LVELALNVTERSMQPIDAAHVQSSVDAWRKADERDHHREHRDDEEHRRGRGAS
jgi:hypothetical protein